MWMLAAVFDLFGLRTSKAESVSQQEQAEEVSNGESLPSEQLVAREIPQLQRAFDELANRLASTGEKPRKAGVFRTVSMEDAEERQATPKQRRTRSFTDEDVDTMRNEAGETLEEAKRRLLAMSGTKKIARKPIKSKMMCVISYVVLSIAVLGAVAGAVFFIWMLIANK